MPKIIFSKHARYQLKERNISEREIRKSIENPDKILKQSPQRFRLIKEIKRAGRSYILIVIFEQKNSFKEIITAFITSKVKKYL